MSAGAVMELPDADIFSDLRAREFARLDSQGQVYLDYTGSGLYAESHVTSHAELLRSTVFGNPHSESPASTRSTDVVTRARRAVLDFLDADPAEYTVCFTANASGALRLVGEAFPFASRSSFVLTTDNHNSVNGIREFARARGAAIVYLPIDHELRVVVLDRKPVLPEVNRFVPNLLAFPAQSNFSGVQYPLGLIDVARRQGYSVLLDAAAFVPTNRLSLREVHPDFVCISMYKMTGYPTGVGALVARRDTMRLLERPWFAGGTVEFASTQHNLHRLMTDSGAFEDGTPNFLDVAAVPAGLEMLRLVGMERIHDHVMALTARLLSRLQALRHPNGRARCRVYGPLTTDRRGATVAFNLLDANGGEEAYEDVERRAGEAGISLRGGCFCNPGASEAAFGIDREVARECLTAMQPGQFTPERFRQGLGGGPVGAVRASLGLASNRQDVDRLIEFLSDFSR